MYQGFFLIKELKKKMKNKKRKFIIKKFKNGFNEISLILLKKEWNENFLIMDENNEFHLIEIKDDETVLNIKISQKDAHGIIDGIGLVGKTSKKYTNRKYYEL